MKLILLLIFNIVCFNLISSKIINPSDIFKGINSNPKIKKIRGGEPPKNLLPKKDVLPAPTLPT